MEQGLNTVASRHVVLLCCLSNIEVSTLNNVNFKQRFTSQYVTLHCKCLLIFDPVIKPRLDADICAFLLHCDGEGTVRAGRTLAYCSSL